MKNNESALEYHQKALQVRQRLLPSTHPFLASTHYNLVKVYRNTGQYKLAEEHARQAVQIASHKLSERHPNLILYKNTLKNIVKT